jgi:hypothetical protein
MQRLAPAGVLVQRRHGLNVNYVCCQPPSCAPAL